MHRVGLENNFRQSRINLWDFNEFVKMSNLNLGYLKRMFDNLFLSMWHTEIPVRWFWFDEKNVQRYNTDLIKVGDSRKYQC